MTNLKEWMDAQWRNPGVQYAGHGVVYESMGDNAPPRTRAGTQRNYMDKATSELRPMQIEVPGKKWGEPSKFKTVKMPNYTWPAHVKQEQAPPVPRKRVPKAKLEQAAAIIAKVPEDELTAFLARFGLSLSLAASIASLGDVEMIARQFLRATL